MYRVALVLAFSFAGGNARTAESPGWGEDQNRFSPLAEVNTANVASLRPVAVIPTGSSGSHIGPPAVAGGMLYVLTPFPHRLLAFDLKEPDLPLRWQYAPEPAGIAAGLGCCGRNGPAVANGRVYFTTLDGHAVALDAATGALLWNVQAADPTAGETLAGTPLPAGDRVILGNAGDDFGARGWVEARSAASGALLWKRYSTGPDEEVGIGAALRTGQANELGVASWPPAGWQHGGGSVSGPIAWDPQTGSIIHGTGHPAPWNPDQRPGENRWTSGLFARDPETGAARWFLSISPHDLHALGSTAASLLVERAWQGQPRSLLLHPDANGHVYVLERGTGGLLAAQPFVPLTATEGLDPATGLLRRNPAKAVRVGGTTRGICPASPGAVGGNAAYSDRTGLLYIPARRLCMDMEVRDTTFMPGTPFTGGSLRVAAAPGVSAGVLLGWDVSTGHATWSRPERLPLQGGVLATAGDLVFYGTAEGMFRAVDARSGAELWHFQAAAGIAGQPISYQGPDGRQYIAVLSSGSGLAGGEIDMRDATAAGGQSQLLRDLPRPGERAGMLHVFGLP
jgi:PQQ-dependent dehydrogenase (methanol/ethanol family)